MAVTRNLVVFISMDSCAPMLNIHGGAAAEPPRFPCCVPSGTRVGIVACQVPRKDYPTIGEVDRLKQEEGRGVVEVFVRLPSADGCTSHWWRQPCSRFEHSACHHTWSTSAERSL